MGRMAVSIVEAPKRIMNLTDPFEAIVSEHYEPLCRFAISLTPAESDARDLTQQTILEIHFQSETDRLALEAYKTRHEEPNYRVVGGAGRLRGFLAGWGCDH